MDLALKVDGLSKQYKNTLAVNNISFEINKGEIFALIGPNGAGKTTTVHMISTLITPTSGTAYINGIDVSIKPQKARENFTYLPDEAGAYKNMKGKEYLRFMASLFVDDNETINEYVNNAVEMCGLGDRLNEKISNYSRGMTRKLLLSRAVMTRPTLAILDEPTSGLDILNGMEIRQIIKNLSKDGLSFLITSHNMLEIEFLSDKVGIINKGVLHDVGSPSELKQKYNAVNLEEVFQNIIGGDY